MELALKIRNAKTDVGRISLKYKENPDIYTVYHY